MQFDEIPNDGKTESQAAENSFRRAVLLAEAREQMRQKLGLDPSPCIFNLNLEPLRILLA